MKQVLLILAACVLVGCSTIHQSSTDKVKGEIVFKEYDEDGWNYYSAAGGTVPVYKPAVWWITVKQADGELHSLPVSEEQYTLLNVGDYWPQS
jgi:uncharacterized protein YceK